MGEFSVESRAKDVVFLPIADARRRPSGGWQARTMKIAFVFIDYGMRLCLPAVDRRYAIIYMGR
jgi:hypothetical protein